MYVLCELDANIVLCDWGGAGKLSARASVSVMPAGTACSRAHHSGCAHILVDAAGERVYATERTTNSVVVLGVSHAKKGGGELSVLQRVSTHGVCPRNFLLEPKRLLVANQDSQNLVEFALQDDGTLVEEPAAVIQTVGVCGNVLCRPRGGA